MRVHFITSLLLVAPCAAALAAQDTTQAQKQTQNQDTLMQPANKGRLSGALSGALSDDVVLRQMHRTNQEEIRLGQLAQRNASSPKEGPVSSPRPCPARAPGSWSPSASS